MAPSGYNHQDQPRPPWRTIDTLLELWKDPLPFLDKFRGSKNAEEIKIPGREFFLLPNPEHAYSVLVSKAAKFIKNQGRRSLVPLIGLSVMTENGKTWQSLRHGEQKAFKPALLDSYVDPVVATIREEIDPWKDGDRQPMLPVMRRLALKIFMSALLGFHPTDADTAAVSAAIDAGLDVAAQRGRALILPPRWLPTPANQRLKHAAEGLAGVVARVMAEADLANSFFLQILRTTEDASTTGRLTEAQVKNELTTYLIAGHETTAGSIAWVYYLLAKHPGVRAKLNQEVKSVLQGQPANAETMGHLHYTRAIVLEILRLYPPAWVIGRQAIEETEFDGVRVPVGATVIVSPWVSHHNPEVFADPDTFRPERWADPAMRNLANCAYFPFGSGQRICPGKSFAEREMTLVLATLAQKMELDLVDPAKEIVPTASVTLRPSQQIVMKVNLN